MKKKIFQVVLLICDIFLVILAFLLVAKLKDGTRRILADFTWWRSLFAFTAIWIGMGLWGMKYSIRRARNSYVFLRRILLCDISAVAVIFGLMYLFRQFTYSRGIVLGTIVGSIALEIFVFIGLYYALRFNRDNPDYARARLVTRSSALEELQSPDVFPQPTTAIPIISTERYEPPAVDCDVSDVIPENEWNKFLGGRELFAYVHEFLHLDNLCRTRSLILNSETYFNIEYEKNGFRQIFVNLHRINDLRRINLYLIRANELLMEGGVFICHGQTIDQRRALFFHRLTPVLGAPVYFLDFLFRRVAPKLPILQGWYFALTKGRNRALSETEMLGRFYFCGFELIHKSELNNSMYFVLKKVKPHRTDPNPTYGPLIRLKRLGKNGRIIYVKKLRTMHPYSEYLQEYVYRTNALQEGGKFWNDFRITAWGRVLRSLWIDELPQLLNFVKGEVTLVGVRALSEHYYSLYPPDMQELRLKFKPGLLPPFYADMPTTFEQIVESERLYIQAKMEKPIVTDFKYLCKGVWNILVKKARSN